MPSYTTSEDGKYTVHPAKMTKDEAQAACSDMNSNLVSINSQEEMELINGLIKDCPKHHWIGFSDEVEEGTWVWDDGSSADFTNWNNNEPNNRGGENCVAIKANQRWNDIRCNQREAFICEYIQWGSEYL